MTGVTAPHNTMTGEIRTGNEAEGNTVSLEMGTSNNIVEWLVTGEEETRRQMLRLHSYADCWKTGICFVLRSGQ